MKTRWKILIVTVVFAGFFAALWLETMRLGAEDQVAAYKKALRDRGEKLEIREVMPAPVPAEQNGADLAVTAINAFVPDGITYADMPPMMKMVAPGKAMIGWQQPDIRVIGPNGYTNSWENLRRAVQADQPAVELARQVADFPVLDFREDYEKNYEMRLPNLKFLHHSSLKLGAATDEDLRNGDTAAATTNIGVLLALARQSREERTQYGQTLRVAAISVAAEATWELLQSSNVSEAGLATLQKSWGEPEYLVQGLEGAILMERAFQETVLPKMRSSNAEVERMMGTTTPSGGSSGGWLEAAGDWLKSVRDKNAVAMWRTTWSYADELNLLQTDQAVLEALRSMETNQCFQPAFSNMAIQTKALKAVTWTRANPVVEFLGIKDDQWLFSEITADGTIFSTLVERVMAAETGKRMVLTAIALKRYQLKHGGYPEKLAGLIPEFLATVPLDAVDGQPLRYQRKADGTYLLYSVGQDGVDDGGDSALPAGSRSGFWPDRGARDWVWPQAATAAEVEKYYADEAAKKQMGSE